MIPDYSAEENYSVTSSEGRASRAINSAPPPRITLPMKTRQPRTGLPLSRLGFGAAQLGNLYRETSDEDAMAAVDRAYERGIRYFDTAPHYGLGLSERRLGAALARRPRDEFMLSTKVGRLLRPNPRSGDALDDEGFAVPARLVRQRDYSRDGVLRSIEESLERLGLGRIDIAYVHDPDDFFDEALTAAIPALVELREQGVVRAIGVGMNQAAMLAEFVRRADVDVVMVAGRYTLLDRSAEDDLLPAAQERGVGVVVAGVFNSGLLARDRPAPGAKYDYQSAPAALVEAAHEIAEICERHGVTLPEASLAFPLRHPAVMSVVLGMRTPSQVDDSLARMSAVVPDALWRGLAARELLRAGSVLEGRQS